MAPDNIQLLSRSYRSLRFRERKKDFAHFSYHKERLPNNVHGRYAKIVSKNRILITKRVLRHTGSHLAHLTLCYENSKCVTYIRLSLGQLMV